MSYDNELQRRCHGASVGLVDPDDPTPQPHHPIGCWDGTLAFDDDGSFSCDHAKVRPGHVRTLAAVRHSIAFLLLEEVERAGL